MFSSVNDNRTMRVVGGKYSSNDFTVWFCLNGYPTLGQYLDPTKPDPPEFAVTMDQVLGQQSWETINARVNTQQS